ncbi:MAG TPA: Re/Si-specific NAD(P)(+) transhydrogenase subunit alpha [Planctomycetaceae bacterium]|nr:Re/Si-specific NAD(P)(+) transhydrogenase subunit alpha [Planctomycetaceae bacterium]
MKVAVVKETFPGEDRVGLVPANVSRLMKAGLEILVETGAGTAACFDDAQYRDQGAQIVQDRRELAAADAVIQIRSLGANPDQGRGDLDLFRSGQVVLGMCDPLGNPQAIAELAETGISLFALEMVPRITRAQSMDVLSSMATIAGYQAVLLSAVELPKMFPMMMTAAGTLSPARVFVIGAGVAGLQAIATARRLGAVVQAYDVRPACREQVESLGARFVELELETGDSEDKGGYAKALGDDFYQKQRALMADIVSGSDIVITTAAIPGKPSPLLITAEAVERMPAGGVIVDLAAERGGNCELSQADQRVVEHGVTILGPTNLPAEIPNHASQMFSNNVTAFLLHLTNEGKLALDLQDEIVQGTLAAHDGQVVNGRLREILELPPLDPPVEEPVEELPVAAEPESGEDHAADSDEQGESS